MEITVPVHAAHTLVAEQKESPVVHHAARQELDELLQSLFLFSGVCGVGVSIVMLMLRFAS